MKLTWPANFVISEGNRVTNVTITNTKLYVPFVTLSIQDNKFVKIRSMQEELFLRI